MKRCPICNTKIIMQDSARCSSCEAEKLRRELQVAQLAHFSTTNKKVEAEERYAEMAIECNVMLTEIADLRARLQTAEQQLRQVREEVRGLRNGLLKIASQHTTSELEEKGFGHGDEEYAYNQCVIQARKTLGVKSGEEANKALSATPSDGCGKGNGGVMSYGPFRERIKALASELRTAGFEYSADCVAVADFDCPDRSPEEEQPPTPPHDQS